LIHAVAGLTVSFSKKNPPFFSGKKKAGFPALGTMKRPGLLGLMTHGLAHFFAFVLCDFRAAFFSQVSHKNSSSFRSNKFQSPKTIPFNVTSKLKIASDE